MVGLLPALFDLMLWPFKQWTPFIVIPVAISFCIALLRFVFCLIRRNYK